MKRLNTYAALLLLGSLTACFAPEPEHAPSESTPSALHGADRVEVHFSIPETRTLAEDEARIVTLDALAFRSDGSPDAYARTDSPELIGGLPSVTLEVTKGEALSWHVIANAPAGALESIATESALNTKKSFLSENASDAFVMASDGTGTYLSESQNVAVAVSRLVSKVSLGAVTASFLSGTGASMTLDAVYLINASGSVRYDLTPLASDWYSQLVRDASLPASVSGLLYRNCSVLALSASTQALDYVFYACPNPTDNGVNSVSMPSWSARNTRLVLETTVDGIKNYYPVTLPAMESNTAYIIREVELRGYGSSHPDKPVSREKISFTITVNPWETETKDITME